jgi:hypothetical protein
MLLDAIWKTADLLEYIARRMKNLCMYLLMRGINKIEEGDDECC